MAVFTEFDEEALSKIVGCTRLKYYAAPHRAPSYHLLLLHGIAEDPSEMKYLDFMLKACEYHDAGMRPARKAAYSDYEQDRFADLERQNSELRIFVAQHSPHKEFLKIALAFLLFFSVVLTVQLLAGIWLVASPLGWLGMALSGAAVLLSYLAALDWRDWKSWKDSAR